MHGARVAFATTGDPVWPADDSDWRSVRVFDKTVGSADDPRAVERGLGEGLR